MSVAKLSAFSTGPYNGRDKLAKVMQFSAKFVAYHMLLNDPKSEFASQLVKFDKQTAMARKGLRLFKSIELYQKLLVAMGKDMGQVEFLLEVVTNVGMMFRWAYDNLSFLEKAKILSPQSYGVTSNKYRVVATCAYIIIALRKFSAASEKIAVAAKAGKQEALHKAQKDQKEALLEFVARVADMVNALNSAKWYQTNEGIQGLAGIVSATINLRKVWLAMKK
mmetsp:Transcript_27445/g.38801  ORF Transcript_27445/g.38801 Transcript_27445/m.38801 type:complete len:222 (+) Transcript_27445:41-706(+)|eukprot:CAMPEP_0175092948 /NCGR_PEP_ID=MMETSP0086_2-20121207/2734_1 /TAXON_ID=136419 /ORGANISM="Unknown Unknown, Strain D1" /LENGTH=221 /DNA_ID=CAMNT_0016365843 /DNA_START=33 /DNA_END=698 /DNA_ORIENTATION=+